MNELRRDYFLDRWVIISTDRAKRPSDFIKPKAPAAACNINDCSFCLGCESKTPPSKATYFLTDSGIRHEADLEGSPPRTGWVVRVIPNMYPAVQPVEVQSMGEHEMSASGVHEVIVESPAHDHHPQYMSDEEIKLLFMVYRDRFHTISKVPYIKYISVFRNYGKDAGASLSHAHSQILALPIVPEVIREQYGLDYGKVIGKESKGPRLILNTEHTVAFAPFASCYTYEAWVFPKKPCKNIAELSDTERDDFAIATRDVLSRLSKLLADPPYNYAFVQSMTDDLYMHLRIYPRLGVEAGFEMNTHVHINSTTPEDAAKSLREI